MRKLVITAIVVAVLAVVIVVAVTLGVVLTRKQPSSPPVDDVISEDASFPNGSYLLDMKSLHDGPSEMAPSSPNASVLAQFGIRVDDSNKVAETGRLSYFYMVIPPQNGRSKRSTSNVNFDVTSIGVHFGDANRINVVPMSLAKISGSGLTKLGILHGGSSVYKIEIRMPESMCSGGDRGACNMISWRPYSLASDNQTAVKAVEPISLPVACGSQCDSPSGTPCASATCQACDGQQVAGADEPVSRRYNMGTQSGNVNFIYETYIVKDRITVRYVNGILFDSQCVGTNGERVTHVAFDGKSKEVRVDVEPDCDRGKNTLWYFTLSCPSPCDYGKKEFTLVNNGFGEVGDNQKVYITKNAEMPSLTAYYCPSDQTAANVEWTFTIEPTKDIKDNCEKNSVSGSGKKWNIPFTEVQGGDASLSWKSGKTTGSLNFKIIGTQPDPSDVEGFISHQDPHWYALAIAKTENNLKQFYPCTGCQKVPDGYPGIAADFGYGVFQITNDPKPTCAYSWNWKANVQAGLGKIRRDRDEAQRWMTRQRNQAISEGYNSTVPIRTEGNCVFEDGTQRTIEDAVAIKMYNGASGGNYCAWNNTSHEWKFNPLNNRNKNYVNEVCNHL